MQELMLKLKAALALPPECGDEEALAAAVERLTAAPQPDDGPEDEPAAEEEPVEAAAPPYAAELAALKEEVAALKAQRMDEQLNAAIAGGTLLPVQREWAAAYAAQDPEGFRRFLANSRPAVAMGAIVNNVARAAAPLRAEQECVNRMLGIGRELHDKYNQ